MKENKVSHSGIVQEVKNGKASISVITKSACVSCQIKGSCTLSDVKEKIIEVDLMNGQSFKTGGQVTVEMKETTGIWAVLLGYFFPFLVVIAGLIIFTVSGMDQGLAGLLSMGLLVPYYLLLYFFRTYIRKKFTFNVR
ncbi:MAG: SoxR reducing system RseC family protein [Bacteroidales bacterium]|nr:SoxR reducing system RseC family protein [Bacteroidales bacterium]